MKIRLMILLAIICNGANAQLSIQNVTASDAANYLIEPGHGVIISNATFTGNASQLAKFNQGNFNFLNFNEGVILTTGRADYEAECRACAPGSGHVINPVPGPTSEHDLNALTPYSLYGPAFLEFDVTCEGSQLNFDFVFGSEEYIEHINDQFNDAFGIFISGPGIVGPVDGNGTPIFLNGAKNIALVPGTSNYLTVHNIFQPGNSSYFIDNRLNYCPIVPGSLNYRGYTVTINANCQVQCGKTYHIKIAISNVSDTALDSGVLLRKGSIKSDYLNPIVANPQPVCEGQPLALTIPNANSSWNYSWSCGQSGVGLSSVTTTANANTSVYTVTATVSSGCTITQSVNVNVNALNNLPPYVNGINNTGEYTAYVQAGHQIQFDIPSFDSQNESVSISWNGGISGASFDNTLSGDIVAQHKKGRFCWTPNNSQIGLHTFTVTVADNNSCQNLSAQYTFKVKVVCNLCNIDVYYENRTPSNNPLPSETKAGHSIVAGTSVDLLQTDGPVNTGTAVVTFRAPVIDLKTGFSAGSGFSAIADEGTCINDDDCDCCSNWNGFTFDYIPNLFTPDGNGVNDIWYLPDVNHPFCAFNANGFDLVIKNRLGSTVYHRIWNESFCCPFEAPNPTTNPISCSSISWDGRTTAGSLCADGVYFMTLTLSGCGHVAYYNSSITLMGSSKSNPSDTVQSFPAYKDNQLITNNLTTIKLTEEENPTNSLQTISPVAIYPNPTTGIIYIDLSDINCKIKLFSVEGKLLFEKNAGSHKESIDLNNWGNGIYLIRIVSDNNEYEQKVIKQ